MRTQRASQEHTHAHGKINVKTYEPAPYDQPDNGPAPVRTHVAEGFSGDIQGEGVATFLQTTMADGDASFVGVERVTGSVGGRSGTFVLQDQGTVKGCRRLRRLVRGPGIWNRTTGGAARRGPVQGGIRPGESTSPSTTGSSEPGAGTGDHRRTAATDGQRVLDSDRRYAILRGEGLHT
jgi:hypothetical protein